MDDETERARDRRDFLSEIRHAEPDHQALIDLIARSSAPPAPPKRRRKQETDQQWAARRLAEIKAQSLEPGAAFTRVQVCQLYPLKTGGLPTESGWRCGWWWCGARLEQVASWTDLRAALAVLRDREIDPRSQEVAQIAFVLSLNRARADQLPEYERLNKMLSRGSLKGHAEELRRSYLKDLRPYLELARRAKPPNPKKVKGRRKDAQPTRRALQYAEGLHGWDADVVAAIALLVGVDRGGWTSILEKVRKMQRPKLGLVPNSGAPEKALSS